MGLGNAISCQLLPSLWLSAMTDPLRSDVVAKALVWLVKATFTQPSTLLVRPVKVAGRQWCPPSSVTCIRGPM